jgi:hypothetical protein
MKTSLKLTFVILATFYVFLSPVKSQEKGKQDFFISTIAFYNLENLFDTIDTPDVNDIDFTPQGSNNWNTEKYYHKLSQLSKVIVQLGSETTKDAPAILGVAEVENRQVLEDLVNTELLKPYGYKIVHYDSPDKRGIDVAFLYQPKYFTLKSSKTFVLKIPGNENFFTRDHLLMSGDFDGEPMHFIVGHWPSRRGGEKKSLPNRRAAGDVARNIIDSISKSEPNAKITFMGDLNDDPVSPSVYQNLRAKGAVEDLKEGDMFNPFYDFFKKGIGTLAWRDSWNLFDQIIISQTLLNDRNGYYFYKAKVFNKQFLAQDSGRFKGYPLRTYAGGQYTGGFSDHFPTYIYLVKAKK